MSSTAVRAAEPGCRRMEDLTPSHQEMHDEILGSCSRVSDSAVDVSTSYAELTTWKSTKSACPSVWHGPCAKLARRCYNGTRFNGEAVKKGDIDEAAAVNGRGRSAGGIFSGRSAPVPWHPACRARCSHAPCRRRPAGLGPSSSGRTGSDACSPIWIRSSATTARGRVTGDFKMVDFLTFAGVAPDQRAPNCDRIAAASPGREAWGGVGGQGPPSPVHVLNTRRTCAGPRRDRPSASAPASPARAPSVG